MLSSPEHVARPAFALTIILLILSYVQDVDGVNLF